MFNLKKILIISLFAFLTSCNYMDDFMLGKDNTPKPSTLTPIVSNTKIQQRWSIATSKGSKTNSYLKLKPVIRQNIIYTASTNGIVQAVNKTNGHLLWSKQLPETIISGPTVSAGVIALGTNRSGVLVLDQNNGNKLLHLKLSGDALSKPLIVNHKLIVKSIDGNLYAFNLLNGKEIWQTEHGSPSLILKASSSPIVYKNMILVGFSDGRLDAVDIKNGRVVWQRSIVYATGSSDVERLVDIDADPIVKDNHAYLASYQGYVGVLSLTNGEFIWRKQASVYKNMAISGNHLYVTDSNDIVWAFDKTTGQVLWKQDALKARGLTEPTLVNNNVLVGDRLGYLHLLSSQNGDFISRSKLNGPVEIAPAVSGSNIYVMTADGKLTHLSVN